MPADAAAQDATSAAAVMRVVRSVLTHSELTQDSSLVEDSMMDSLALTELIAQLRDAVGPHVDRSVLFGHPTVRGLAALLRSKQPSPQQRGRGRAARAAAAFDKETQTAPGFEGDGPPTDPTLASLPFEESRLLVERGARGGSDAL